MVPFMKILKHVKVVKTRNGSSKIASPNMNDRA